MIVYVEYVIVDNMVIDTLILLLTKKLALQKTKNWRIFLSAVFGTIVALVSPILPNWANLVSKPLVAILMIALAFEKCDAKKFLTIFFLFFLSTFVFGGACIGICEMFGIKYIVQNGTAYEYKFPIGFVLLVCYVTYLCAKNIIQFCHKKHSNDEFLFDVTFENGGMAKKTTAFLDTGNCLEFENMPITIVNFDVFESLFPNVSIAEILLKKDIKNAKYINILSVGKMQEKMLVVKIDKLTIGGKTVKNAPLGLSIKNFAERTNSDAIISKKILEMKENEF